MTHNLLKKALLLLPALLLCLGAAAQDETVILENRAAGGQTVNETASINWATQEVYAQIDLTNCSGTNENVLSVGQNIGAWNGECFHLYYTQASQNLQVNYVSADGNPIRKDISGISGTVTITISKADGITVNGTKQNYNGATEVDVATACSGLWALTSLQVGSAEGSTRSNATFVKVSVRNLESGGDEPGDNPEDNPSYSPTASTDVFDFSGFGDTDLLQLFKTALDNGRTYPTDAEFAAAGIQQSDIAFIRSHVEKKALLNNDDRVVPGTFATRQLWMNLPMNVGKNNTGGQPTGQFSSDTYSIWNYTNLFGAWNHSFFTAPSAWTDAAHKNGTDMMSGIKFFDTTGGRTEGANSWVNFIAAKDAQGNYIYAEPLINLLMYFGFDGINYNWEDTGFSDEDAVRFHQALYKIAAQKGFDNFHCGIYTSSNSLTSLYASGLFGDENGRTHDLMLNYMNGDFTSASAMRTSVQTAQRTLGTTDGLYAGVWIVSMDRGWSRLDANDYTHQIGICLWGEHSQSRFWSYNTGGDAYDQQSNYQKLLERAASGGNRNPLNRPRVSDNGNNWEQEGTKEPLSSFAGLATWIPERSTIQGNLPFATGFNMGNGDRYSYKGRRTAGQWYNLGTQDVVPTYRWLVVEPGTLTASSNIKPEFTTLDQYTGGTSLLLTGRATAAGTDVVLYKTSLNVSAGNPYAKVAVKNGKGAAPSNLYVILKKSDGTWVETPYGNVSGSTWEEKQLAISGLSAGDVITAIGLRVKGNDDSYKLYVGKLEINDDVKATPANVTGLNVEVKEETKGSLTAKLWWNTTAQPVKRAQWGLAYNDEGNIDHFEVLYKNGENGRVSEVGRTTSWGTIVPNIEFESANDNPFIGVRAVSTDLKTYSPVVWVNVPRAQQDSLPEKRDDSYGISQIDPSADGYDTAVKIRYVTDVTTSGADQDLAFHNGGPVADGTNYRDATDNVLRVHQGQTFTLNVKAYDTSNLTGTDGLRYCFGRGWIDLDGNHMFSTADLSDGGECLFTVGTTRAATPSIETQGINVTVTIPNDAATGKSRLRVVFADAWFSGTLMPTGLTSKGFTIDLGVEITGSNPGRTVVDTHDQGTADEPEGLNASDGISVVKGKAATVKADNGKLNISGADRAWVYDASGQLVSFIDSPAASTTTLAKGVYLVKTQSGAVLRTQKLIVR